MTLTQTVEIPADKLVRFDFVVPREIPAGVAQVEFKVIPFAKEGNKDDPPLKCLAGVKTPRSDRLLGAAANLGDATLEELRDEWLAEKYLK